MSIAFALPLALLASFVQPSVQTAKPAAPATVPAAVPTSDVLGYGEAEQRMTVPVTIGGAGPYGFIVDTGSQRTVISRELAGTLGLARGRNVNVTAMAGTANVATVVIPTISVSVIGGSRIEAPTLEGRNLGAPGLLGIDTLQGHAVTIDFVKQQMTLVPATKRLRREALAPDEIVVHAKNMLGQLVVTDAYFHGERIQVILDTGSVVSMGNLALQRRVASRTKHLGTISLLAVTGASLQADYTQVDQIKVAGVDFQNLPIAFADAAPFHRFNLVKRPALMLGMDALKLFRRVRIDFPNREIRLAIPGDLARG